MSGLAGMIIGGLIVGVFLGQTRFVTQQMALDRLEQKCTADKSWEYRTPNPETTETLLRVECNPIE